MKAVAFSTMKVTSGHVLNCWGGLLPREKIKLIKCYDMMGHYYRRQGSLVQVLHIKNSNNKATEHFKKTGYTSTHAVEKL